MIDPMRRKRSGVISSSHKNINSAQAQGESEFVTAPTVSIAKFVTDEIGAKIDHPVLCC